MIRCVLSDLGRVIIHFDNTIFFEKIADYSPLSKEDIAEMASTHSSPRRAFDRGDITAEEFYDQVTAQLDAKIDYDNFYAIYNDVFSLDPSILEILKRLKGKYRLVLLSNTDVMRFGFIKKKFPEIMIFDAYVLSYVVGEMKPHPRIYDEALKKAGVEARECVFIDDIAENIKAAQKLGIKGILMTPQTDLEAALQEMDLSF
ncbi:MAG: HAD family phosphatase [Candidatus Aminicenantes bacterium]|jgi:putative hydrolase of the HAD superfamily